MKRLKKFKLTKKTWIIITIVIAVAVLLFVLKGNNLNLPSASDEEIKSNAEASTRLTDVANDITSFREELDSLTRTVGS